MCKAKFFLVGLALACLSTVAAASPDGVIFEQRAPYVSGAAVVSPATGGDYVYSSQVDRDKRGTSRFMLGRPPRQHYELFSAQEEAALWQYKHSQLESLARSRARRIRRRPAPKITWPKVVQAGDKTCVPLTAFSSAADWRQHVVCWSAGDQRVE